VKREVGEDAHDVQLDEPVQVGLKIQINPRRHGEHYDAVGEDESVFPCFGIGAGTKPVLRQMARSPVNACSR